MEFIDVFSFILTLIMLALLSQVVQKQTFIIIIIISGKHH